jgi:predicted metalloprotease with PDZ domain
VRSNPARLTVSPYQASFQVAAANNGRGNSNGFQISYYNLGWLAGMCLDIEIRQQSGGKHSLDDVAHALYDLCKDNKPGFEEDEIRKQCIRFGGPSLGAFYDKVVMSPGELPIEEQLAKVGW